MESENWKEVDFKTYCPKCKYKKLEETKDPCNECLAEGAILNTKKPLRFKEKGVIFYEKRIL